MNTTPKEERDEAFYQDAFTSSSTWGPNVFESQCKEHGITEEDDEFFCHTAVSYTHLDVYKRQLQHC